MNRGTRPHGYQPLNREGLIKYLSTNAEIATTLGGQSAHWHVKQLTGGNLNLVHAISGPSGSVCTKQSLPYLRVLGENAPMPLDRIVFEQRAMQAHAKYVSNLVPRVLYFDESLFLLIMEYLDGYVELRQLLINGEPFDYFSEQLACYMARTMFLSSDLALTPSDRRLRAASMAGNWGMYKWMEELAYTDPYIEQPRNSWNSPYLDDLAHEFRSDGPLKLAVSQLKAKYMADPATLVHGDFHTDSILVKDNELRVIDFEHSFYGPFGYDFGHLFGHLLLNYFSQCSTVSDGVAKTECQIWITHMIHSLWEKFSEEFTLLWRSARTGGAYEVELFENCADLESSNRAREHILQNTLSNAIGFTGIEMVRRILTVGQVSDLERLKDPQNRSIAERRCLKLGRHLILNSVRYTSISSLTAAAEIALADKI